MENEEGPYREKNGYVEKEDLESYATKEDLEQMGTYWKKELSGTNFLWIVLATLLFSVFMSFDTASNRLLVRQNEHYRQILIQQVSPEECFLRHNHMSRQMQAAADCADICIGFLSVDYKTASEHDADVRNTCQMCLLSVSSPMPFEVANPPCSRHLR